MRLNIIAKSNEATCRKTHADSSFWPILLAEIYNQSTEESHILLTTMLLLIKENQNLTFWEEVWIICQRWWNIVWLLRLYLQSMLMTWENNYYNSWNKRGGKCRDTNMESKGLERLKQGDQLKKIWLQGTKPWVQCPGIHVHTCVHTERHRQKHRAERKNDITV